jgi:integrase
MASGSVIEYRGKRGTVWRIKYADASGKQVMETVGSEAEGWTKRKTREALDDRLSDVRRKGYRKPAPSTFRAYAESWFDEGETRRGWKPGTVASYRSLQRRLVAHFGPMPLAAIRPRHVAAFVAEHKQGPATISRDVSLLHAIIETARREELVESNPAARAERPKIGKRRWRILEPAEVARVLRAFTDEQTRTIFLTLVLTGLRRHELRNLRWRDVNLLEGVLRVRASKSEEGIRSIALPRPLVAALSEQYQRTQFKGEAEYVFCHPQRGSRYGEDLFAKRFRAALKEAGITDYVRPFHDLRHTALTNEAAAGSSPIALMSKAGHSNMKTTQIYLHLAGTVFRAEAEAHARRLLGVEASTNLTSPEGTSDDLEAPGEAEGEAADAL